MERTITYKITDSGQNIRIDSFLRKHGYSMQNLTLLKKMPESILKTENGLICKQHFRQEIF